MKIIIDNSNLNVGGGIQVATSFLNDLNTMVNINSKPESLLFYIIQSVNSSKQIDKTSFSASFKFYDLDINCQNSIPTRVRRVKKIENQIKPDVIFTVFGPSYHKSKCPKIVGFAIPHIIYKDSPYFRKLPIIDLLKLRMSNLIKSYCFDKFSDVLIFETDDARDIYTKSKNIKAFTISNTLNSIFLSQQKWKPIEVTKSDFDILCLSANYPHKNLEIIPQVIEDILMMNKGINFRFHVTGDRNEFNFEERHNDLINYLGKVDLVKIPFLYTQMDCLFMPTLLEVFSTTYLEAMFMEIPIVTSNLSFARYICGESALYCSPLDAGDYARSIMKIYNDQQLRDRLVRNGLINLERFVCSMQRSQKYLEIIKNTYEYANTK